MTKRGTKQNPLILRVADESKIDDISEICHENGWHFILGFEPDKEEDLTDLERKLYLPVAMQEVKKVGRNEPCECGNGKNSRNAA